MADPHSAPASRRPPTTCASAVGDDSASTPHTGLPAMRTWRKGAHDSTTSWARSAQCSCRSRCSSRRHFCSPQPSCFSCGAGVPFDLTSALEALGQETDRHVRSGAQSTQGGRPPAPPGRAGRPGRGTGGNQQSHVEAALVVLASALGAHLQRSAPSPIAPPQPTHAPSSGTRGDEVSKGKCPRRSRRRCRRHWRLRWLLHKRMPWHAEWASQQGLCSPPSGKAPSASGQQAHATGSESESGSENESCTWTFEFSSPHATMAAPSLLEPRLVDLECVTSAHTSL